MNQRPDTEREDDGANSDRSAQRDPGDEHAQLDGRPNNAQRVPTSSDARHEAVARSSSETCADVQAGRDRVQDDGDAEQCSSRAHVGKVRQEVEAHVHDGRGAHIGLTDLGLETLEAAAPHHVESVRRHFIDLLTPDEIETLAQISQKVIDHLTNVLDADSLGGGAR